MASKDEERLAELIGGEADLDGEQVRLRVGGVQGLGLLVRADDASGLGIERALAHALLRAEPGQFVIVGAPRVSADVEEQLQRFMAQYGQGRGWGFLDDGGDARLFLPSLGVDERRRIADMTGRAAGTSSATGNLVGVRNQSLFTDLNQWLLKVLILSHAPPGIWDRPRLEVRGPVDLSHEAWIDVSQGKAYQFAHTLREMGHVIWKRGVFRLVDVDRLMDAWLAVARTEHPLRTPVRSMMSDDVRNVFAPDEEDHAFAGTLAAEAYAFSHVSGGMEEVYALDDVRRVADRAMLEICDEARAEFFLVQPLYRQSVSRGVQRRDGQPVVDFVQLALDAVRRPARGREQADLIVREILRWFE